MGNIRKLSKNVYTLSNPATKEAGLVTFGDTDAGNSAGSGAGSRSDYVPWGLKDGQLVKMHKLASESPSKWRLIKTRRDFICGLGVYTHNGQELKASPTRYKPKVYPEFTTWKQLVNFDLEFVTQALQYVFAANVFVQFTLDKSKKVVGVECIDAFKCRIRKLKAGETKKSAFLVNPNFGTKAYKPADTKVIPAFDPADPGKYPVFILQLMDKMPGNDYYSFPEWWSTEEWATVANMIPKFHKAGLTNGYNIKYHISIPDDYFDKEGLDEKAKEKLKEEVLSSLAECFSGTENAEKALFTFHQRNMTGEKVNGAGVIITPMKNTMSDDAYTGLYNAADRAQASGHGVQPVLAGIDTGSKMGSGKELESAANYQQNYLTYVDRLILLQVLYVTKRINGWPDEMDFDIRNITMYTYDVTPKGTQQNPNEKPAEADAEEAQA